MRQYAAVQQISAILGRFTADEQQRILSMLSPTKEGIPISVFNCPLSGLEIVVRYMKDVENNRFTDIAAALNRKPTTIHTTYTQARKKFSGALNVSDCSVVIPVSVVAERRASVLESIVVYLEGQKFSLKKIALLLHRSYNTVKTVRRRALLKGVST